MTTHAMRRNRLAAIIGTVLFLSCQEDTFPNGIYGYQVERLLSSGTAKTWNLSSRTIGGQVSRPAVCLDSVNLLIESVTDSISVARLIPRAGCMGFDTVQVGKANASFIPSGLVFTDSLNFASGDFWLVQEITQTKFTYATMSGKQETFTWN